jgi:hypothetical protein
VKEADMLAATAELILTKQGFGVGVGVEDVIAMQVCIRTSPACRRIDFFDLVGNVDDNAKFWGASLFVGCSSDEVYRLPVILDSEFDIMV